MIDPDSLLPCWWKDSPAALSSRVYTYHDPVADGLLLSWDRTRPAENIYIDIRGRDYVSFRNTLDTAEVVGIEIEALQPLALRRHPSWQRLVDIAGVDEFKPAAPADYPAIAAFIAEIAALPLA